MSGSSSECRQSMGQQMFLNWDSTLRFSSLINSNIERPTRRCSEFPSSFESRPRSGFATVRLWDQFSVLAGSPKVLRSKTKLTFILDFNERQNDLPTKKKVWQIAGSILLNWNTYKFRTEGP